MDGSLKSPRPVPVIMNEVSFSHRKLKKLRGDDYLPPRAPVKTVPPISRVFKRSRRHTIGPMSVSFRNHGDGLKSPHYNSKSTDLYFEQCFENISKLGAGSFGDVFKVRSKEDNRFYAIKKSRDRFRGHSDRKFKLEEVNKMEKLEAHPNCVQFIKAWEEREHLYIQTELCEMSLKDKIEKSVKIKESDVWDYFVDLTLGLKHIHKNGLVHMDIKPANAFIGLDGLCKIGDFGLVLELSKCDVIDALEGDPKYLAPELMQGSFSQAADIFSLGITLLEMASDLELPKGGETWHQLRNQSLPDAFTQGLSPELKRLISWMMDPLPFRRPTVDELLADPAVKQVWKRRRRVYFKSRMYKSISKFCLAVFTFFIWLWMFVTWPFRPAQGKLNTPMSEKDDSFITADSSFSNDELYDMSPDSGLSTPDTSISLDDLSFSRSIPNPYWHGEEHRHSPTMNHLTPCAHEKPLRTSPVSQKLFCGNGRLTPPMVTSSPEHGRYTPPMDGVRGRLFDSDVLSKTASGPRNLMEVFEDAAVF